MRAENTICLFKSHTAISKPHLVLFLPSTSLTWADADTMVNAVQILTLTASQNAFIISPTREQNYSDCGLKKYVRLIFGVDVIIPLTK